MASGIARPDCEETLDWLDRRDIRCLSAPDLFCPRLQHTYLGERRRAVGIIGSKRAGTQSLALLVGRGPMDAHWRIAVLA